LTALAALICAMSFSPIADAQAPAPAPSKCPDYIAPEQQLDARALTMHGVSCFEAGDYERALHFYLRAYEQSPEPLLRGAIGRSLHELGIYGPARRFYLDYLDSPASDSSSARRIQERVDQLEDSIQDEAGTLEVRSDPAGAHAHLVMESGEWFELGPTPLKTKLRPGSYEVALTHEDHHTRRATGRVASGRATTLERTMVANDAAFNVSAAGWRKGGSWTMLASAPFAVAGTALLVLSAQDARAARDAEDRYDDPGALERRRVDLLERSDSFRTWGTAGAAVGAAGILTGMVIYLSANRLASPGGPSDAEAQSGFDVQPELGANYAGVRVRF